MDNVKFGFKAVLTLAILAGCFSLVDVGALRNALAEADAGYFALTLGIMFVGSILVPALLTWNALVESRIDLSFGRLVVTNLALRFYMLVLPRPVSIGMRWARYKKGGSGIDAFALMVFERLVQLVVYSFTAVILLGLTVDSLPQFGYVVWLLSIAVFLVTTGAMLPFFSGTASRLLAYAVDLTKAFMPIFLTGLLGRLLGAVTAFQGLKSKSIATVVCCSLVSYVLLIAGSYVLMQTMDFTISLVDLAWIRSVIFIFAQIPLTVGGIGLREVGFISLLQMYGVAEHDALAYSLLFLFVHIIIGLVGIACDGAEHVRRRLQASA